MYMHFKSILCAWCFQNLTIKTTVHKKRIFTNTNYQNPKLNLSYLVLWSMPKPKVIFSDKSKENFYVWDKNWIWFCRYAQMQKCVDFIKEDKIFFKFFMDSLTVECCDDKILFDLSKDTISYDMVHHLNLLQWKSSNCHFWWCVNRMRPVVVSPRLY